MNALPKFVPNRFFLVLLLGTISVCEAATIVADGVRCSLVDAITAANTNAATNGCLAGDDGNDGGDVIDLRTDVLLTEVNNTDADGCGNGLPAVIGELTIQGNGHTISRSTAEGLPSFRLFDSTAGNLTLKRATVTGGRAFCPAPFGGGGGIKGRVTLTGSTVSGNRAYPYGGGIQGHVMLTDSTVSANDSADGGGGGIQGNVTLINSQISGNTASYGDGGGILGVVLSINGTISGNNCFGSWESGKGNGGGIAGAATLINSTVSGNIGRGFKARGAGIYGAATLINSTVTDNSSRSDSSSYQGGGIYAVGTVNITNSVVAGNRPNDLNILSNYLSCDGTIFAGVNLIGDGSCDAAVKGQLTGDALLGPLADNGGPTLTHALLPGSPAIDAGDDAVCAVDPVHSVDQRGVTRPQGLHCDLGAFELSTTDSDNAAPALIQSRWPDKAIGSFEVVVREDEQLCHYYRSSVTPGYPWAKTACFGEGITTAPALIQSTFGNPGNFEVVVGEGNQLCHYYRNNSVPGQPWSKTQCFGDNIASNPSLIQSRWPGKPIGSFEVVVREGEQLCHYYRSNVTPGYPWNKTACFGEAVDSAPALIQSSFGNPGNFEVVVKEGDQLCHYYRNNSARGYPWGKTQCFSSPVDSAPALIQSRWPGKPVGSFEVVVREQDQLCHYYRSNVTLGYPWAKTVCFGAGVTTAPALIQSTIGNPGNFEIVVGRTTEDGTQGLQHYYRANSASGYPWYDTSLFGVADN